MNRGSKLAASRDWVKIVAAFNEAPIHESGKCDSALAPRQ